MFQKGSLALHTNMLSQRAIEVFEITESVIPTRDYSKNLQPVGKKGWY